MKFGWNEEEIKLQNTLISSISIVGLAIGSFLGGKAVSKGRRKAIFVFNIIAIIGSLICQVLTVPTLCIGRFLCGIAGGVLNVVLTKSIYETVPSELSGLYGNFTNLFICGGIMLVTLCGLILPTDKADFVSDESWRFIYAMPIVFSIVQMLLFLIVYRSDPILFSIGKGDD